MIHLPTDAQVAAAIVDVQAQFDAAPSDDVDARTVLHVSLVALDELLAAVEGMTNDAMDALVRASEGVTAS